MKSLSLLFAFLVSVSVAFCEGGAIATIDLAKLIQDHPKTEQNKKFLEEKKADSEARRDEKIKSLAKHREETTAAIQQAENDALNETARLAARDKAKSLARQVAQEEAELRDFVAGLQKELSQAEMKCLTETVADIQTAVRAVAKESNVALVLDASKNPIGGYSPVFYSDDSLDITEAVAARLPKAEK